MPHAPEAIRKARVVLEVENAEQQRLFRHWCHMTGVDIDQLDNEGCGCCVDIYLLFCPDDDLRMLDALLQPCGAGVEGLTDRS